MCARRFLIAVAILTMLAVAAAFAIHQWGSEVLIRQAVPRGHFEAPSPSSGPDYSRLDSWIARPEIRDDPSDWRPEGVPPPLAVPKRASAFYIHPTTYLDRDRWNAPLRGADEADERAALFVRSQASVFANAVDVWAPRYRQAAYGAFLLNSDDAQRSLDLAFSDVAAAFDEFLESVPDGRPVILAGHSQGALHLMRLLEERKKQLRNRLVAAYVVGWPVSVVADLPSLGFPACAAPEETGCILSWMSFAEPANPRLILAEWERTSGSTGAERNRDDILCVNPVTGIQGGASPPQSNPGTLVPTASLDSARIEAGRVGARCERGLLLISGDIPALGPFVLPGNNYHVYDYALFWWGIMHDSDRRLGSWLER